ncbi:OadG family protein [Alcanivorax sp. 24]|uniref:OadG family protein n=1 Tax=Alcanivorax sp. 24 TaxID=2545266 RepID=UPI00105CB8F2|nr:OadG family protein [Alcanivorax sp. 24]
MTALLSQGLELMLLGMGVVMTFLLILVGVMVTMAALINRFAPAATAPPAATDNPASSAEQPSPQVLAAIQAAIRQHRATRP